MSSPRLLLKIPPFVDFQGARNYPIVIPPVPVDARLLPRDARVHASASGACTIELVR